MNCQRHILLPDVHNFRDLGGYPAADGRVIKWGLTYRTDSLSGLTEEGWQGLKDLDVCCVIDLRSAREREQLPVEPLYPLTYLTFSLMGNGEGDFIKSTRLDYTSTLFTNIECAVDILDAILSVLENSEGSIAYMCTAGKDRTGMVSALLLYLCGVPDEDIIADYMVSNVYNTNGVNKKMDLMIKDLIKRGIDPAFMEAGMSSSPDTMRTLLDSFKDRDIKKVLSDNGFGPEKQEKLRELMTQRSFCL